MGKIVTNIWLENYKLFKVARMSAPLSSWEVNGCIPSLGYSQGANSSKLNQEFNKVTDSGRGLAYRLGSFIPSLCPWFVAYSKICLYSHYIVFTVKSECFIRVCQSQFILLYVQSHLLNSLIFVSSVLWQSSRFFFLPVFVSSYVWDYSDLTVPQSEILYKHALGFLFIMC